MRLDRDRLALLMMLSVSGETSSLYDALEDKSGLDRREKAMRSERWWLEEEKVFRRDRVAEEA